MPTVEIADRTITYQDDLAFFADYLSGDLIDLFNRAWSETQDLDAYLDRYPVENWERCKIALDKVSHALWGVLDVALYGCVLPDALTIAEELSADELDLAALLARLDAAENRLAVLEGREFPAIPTLDSLTTEAQERKAEIAEAWIDLIGDIMTLEV